MSTEIFIGRVKWFNNKTGYGFITVTDGKRSGNDIFVHHSVIGVASQQYKYLVQGEYVDFELSATQSGTHEFQAINVVGIKGGKLMCETRHEFKMTRSAYKSTSDPIAATPKSESKVSESKVSESKVSESKVSESKVSESKVSEFKPKVPRQKKAPTTTDGDKKDWTFVGSKKQSRS